MLDFPGFSQQDSSHRPGSQRFAALWCPPGSWTFAASPWPPSPPRRSCGKHSSSLVFFFRSLKNHPKIRNWLVVYSYPLWKIWKSSRDDYSQNFQTTSKHNLWNLEQEHELEEHPRGTSCCGHRGLFQGFDLQLAVGATQRLTASQGLSCIWLFWYDHLITESYQTNIIMEMDIIYHV